MMNSPLSDECRVDVGLSRKAELLSFVVEKIEAFFGAYF